MALSTVYPLSALGHDVSPRADRINTNIENKIFFEKKQFFFWTFIEDKRTMLERLIISKYIFFITFDN